MSQRKRPVPDGKPPGAKRRKPAGTASALEVDHAPARVRFAVARLDAGDRYCATRDAIVARFRVGERTAERDIERAYQLIAAELESERPTLAARIFGRAWRLALGAEKRRDTFAAIGALTLASKVAGIMLDKPATIEVSPAGSFAAMFTAKPERDALTCAVGLTNAQRLAELDRLRADPDLAADATEAEPNTDAAISVEAALGMNPTIDDEGDTDDDE